MTSTLLEQAFAGKKVKQPRVNLASNSFGLIRDIVSDSQFLCLLPDRFVERDVAAGRLVKLKQSLFDIRNNARLFYPARTKLTPAAEQLMEEFRRASAWKGTGPSREKRKAR